MADQLALNQLVVVRVHVPQPFYFMWASGEVGESQQTVNLSPLAE